MIRERETSFPITQEVVENTIAILYQKHAAFPNWKDGEPELPRLRFFIGDSVFCVNGSHKFIERLFKRLPEGGIRAEYFAAHFYAEKRDIQAEDGNLTALNRGWLDFKFYENPDPKIYISLEEIMKRDSLQLAIGIPTYA